MDADLVSLSSKISNSGSKDGGSKLGAIMMKTVTPPPPPEPKKTQSKKKEEKEKEKEKELVQLQKELKEDEMVEIRRKVHDYLTDPKFKEMLGSIDLPESKAKDLEWRAAYESINATLKSTYKKVMVRTMFESGCQVSEAVMVQFLSMDRMMGLTDDIMSNIGDFEPELTELAIELSNGWVPGPTPRLLMKLFSRIKKYGDRSQLPKEEKK